MGRLFVVDLEGNIYSCRHCNTHLGLADDVISRSFHCRHGRAYLFDNVVNITVGEKEERLMMTGMHTVVDIFCVGCGASVGWKYVRLILHCIFRASFSRIQPMLLTFLTCWLTSKSLHLRVRRVRTYAAVLSSSLDSFLSSSSVAGVSAK